MNTRDLLGWDNGHARSDRSIDPEEPAMPDLRTRLSEARTMARQRPVVQIARIEQAIAHHEAQAPLDLSCLCYVCLECGSIGSTHDRANRDLLVRDFDFTCCDPRTTVLFRSIP